MSQCSIHTIRLAMQGGDRRAAVEEFKNKLQMEFVREYADDIDIAIPPTLPVRLSALEEGIETAREKKERGVTGSLWDPTLTEEQAEAARFLIENAQPAQTSCLESFSSIFRASGVWKKQ